MFQRDHKTKVVMMRNNTGPCYDRAFDLRKPFTKEPYKRSTCSMCLCSKSFLMCLWRQRFPNNFDWLSSYCAPSPAAVVFFPFTVNVEIIDCDAVFYVASSWTVSRTEDLSIQCDTEALHGSLCCSLPMCPFSTRPRTPSGLRETLAFELLSCHFLLLENRETRREHWPTQICPSIKAYIHPSARLGEWTQSYPYSIHDYN